MTVIENINIAYVSQDLSLLSSPDADGTKDLRYLSVFAIGCMILPLREDRRNCLYIIYLFTHRSCLSFFLSIFVNIFYICVCLNAHCFEVTTSFTGTSLITVISPPAKTKRLQAVSVTLYVTPLSDKTHKT